MKTKTAVKKTEKKEPENELVVYRQKVEGMKSLVEKTIVKDQETAGQVAGIVANIKLLAKKIEEKRDKIKVPAQAIVKEANATYNPMIEACEQAERTLKGKYQTWVLAEEKKQQDQELNIAKKVESGYIKAETAVEKLENIKPVEKTVKSDNGSMLSIKRVPVAVIKEPDKIPDAFWIIDEVAVRKAALARHKSQLPQIPGVIIEMRIDTQSK